MMTTAVTLYPWIDVTDAAAADHHIVANTIALSLDEILVNLRTVAILGQAPESCRRVVLAATTGALRRWCGK